MNIVVINGSPRKNGNTSAMISEFIRGAQEAGHSTVRVDLAGKKIAGCISCYHCMKERGICCQKDDMLEIYEVLRHADLVAFASPIYWFDLTAQMKACIDRLFALGAGGFPFHKAVLLLDSAGKNPFRAAIQMFQETCEYVKWENCGIVTVEGMKMDASNLSPEQFRAAYDLGKAL